MYIFFILQVVFYFVYFYFLILLTTDDITPHTVNPSKAARKPGITKELLQRFRTLSFNADIQHFLT
jgi:hypothetical protein